MRHLLASPRHLRRLAWGLILVGALLFAVAVVLRDRDDRGGTPTNVSYLLDALGFLLAVAGAVQEARVGSLFFEFAPRPARRRAVLEAVVGLGAGLVGCVALGSVRAGEVGDAVRPLLAAALAGGLGAGLAGLFTLGWFYGLNWAATRMERLDRAEVDRARQRSGRGGGGGTARR